MTIPMPNEELDGRIVVASCWYRMLLESDIKEPDDDWPDDVHLVLLLNQQAPFFSVACVGDPDWEILHEESHMNIVYAVRAYEQWGGDV